MLGGLEDWQSGCCRMPDSFGEEGEECSGEIFWVWRLRLRWQVHRGWLKREDLQLRAQREALRYGWVDGWSWVC